MNRRRIVVILILSLCIYLPATDFQEVAVFPLGESSTQIKPFSDEGGSLINPLFLVFSDNSVIACDPFNNRVVKDTNGVKAFISIPDNLLIRASVLFSDDENLYIFSDSTLSALDLSGNLFWQVQFAMGTNPLFISQNSDYLFMVTSQTSKSIVLLKETGRVIGYMGKTNNNEIIPYIKTKDSSLSIPYLLEYDNLQHTFLQYISESDECWWLSDDKNRILITSTKEPYDVYKELYLPATPGNSELGIIQCFNNKVFMSLIFPNKISIVQAILE